MDSTFEIQRQTHEEIERLERVLATLLSLPVTAKEQRLRNEHKAAQALERISAKRITLLSLYEDQEARKIEQDLLSATAQKNDLSEFYARLVKIQEHHNKYPDAVPAGFDLEIAAFLDEPGQDDEDYEEEDRRHPPLFCHTLSGLFLAIALLFSGEEGYGRYLDLYTNHTAYCNLKNIGKRPGYLQYLDLLLAAENKAVHSDLPKDTRLSKDFETCVSLAFLRNRLQR